MPCVMALNWIRTSTLASFRAAAAGILRPVNQQRQVSEFLRKCFTFSSFEDEGHTFPTRIIDPQRRRGKCGARGV